MLKVGTHVQDFSLFNEEGELFRLSNYYGKKVVLYFYPKADTPGCTTQACTFRDHFDDFREKDVLVVGISKDSLKAIKKFKEKFQLPFQLLSDEDTLISQYFGVWVEKSMYGKKYMGIQRATFILDESGVITHVFEKASPDTNAEDILEVI
jgi:thioredoxin-dependent peroxiredoxin